VLWFRRAAQRAGAKRVVILDWDVHHGNGTQHIFERDPTVFYMSIHRWVHCIKFVKPLASDMAMAIWLAGAACTLHSVRRGPGYSLIFLVWHGNFMCTCSLLGKAADSEAAR
jgi:hypothetical protein